VASGSSPPGPLTGDTLFAIGDIHGCATELRELVERLPLRPDATLVFLGDYIDRGRESKEVIETILELARSYDVVPLLGNHEEMLFEFLEDPSSNKAMRFILNGGSATLASYGDEQGTYEIPETHLQFLHQCRLMYETDTHCFVHAGVPEIPLAQLDPEQHRKTLLWSRGQFLRSSYAWSKTIVHGHTRVTDVELHANRINLDTGCVYGGQLSAMGFPSQEIYSVARQGSIRPHYLQDPQGRRRSVRFRGVAEVRVHHRNRPLLFQTRDYSPLGMCMRALSRSPRPQLSQGDRVEGTIMPDAKSWVEFTGHVVWVQQIDEETMYGVELSSTHERT
jgi:serine/threonine protein phosphatase 1